MERPRTVLIVDDHPVTREGLKAALRLRGWEVLAEAEHGKQAIELAHQLSPHIAVVDISLPDMSGLEVICRIKEDCPDARVVVLSAHCEGRYVLEALEAGARGYVAKRSALEKLCDCLDAVADGNVFVDSSLSGAIVEGLRGHQAGKVSEDAAASLTDRERQVVRILAQGFSSREVGKKLFISRKTVDNHRANILKKLGLGGPVDLVRYALSNGLVDLESWTAGSPETPPQGTS